MKIASRCRFKVAEYLKDDCDIRRRHFPICSVIGYGLGRTSPGDDDRRRVRTYVAAVSTRDVTADVTAESIDDVSATVIDGVVFRSIGGVTVASIVAVVMVSVDDVTVATNCTVANTFASIAWFCSFDRHLAIDLYRQS